MAPVRKRFNALCIGLIAISLLYILIALQHVSIWDTVLNQSFIPNPEIIDISHIDPNKFTNISMAMQHLKYKLNNHILQYLNFTDDITNISTHNFECGRIWLYHYKGLILSITSITNNTIYIKNISPYRSHCNASRITIYITIHGIEYLGGLAIAHQTKCEWYYTFHITISDEYKIIARLLYYDGDLDAHYKKCNASFDNILYNEMTTIITPNGAYQDDTYIFQRISSGKKFYAPHEQCCEWCTRLKNCIFYISNDDRRHANDEQGANRCIMFNETAIHNMQVIGVKELKNKKWNKLNTQQWIYGHNRKEKTKYYLGSLAPTTPTQRDYCSRKEYDMIFNSGQYVWLQSNFMVKSSVDTKSVCSYDNIQQIQGRWLRINNDKSWYPKQCELEDLYCNVPVLFTPYHCQWRYNDTVQLIDDLYGVYGIKKIWYSGDSIIKNMVKYMKRLFKPEIFECGISVNCTENICVCPEATFIVKKYIAASVWNKRRLIEKKRNGREEVLISNFFLVHKLWHDSIDEVEDYLNKMGEGYDKYFKGEYGNDPNEWPMRIIVELPLIISEREYHCTAPRVLIVNELIHRIFEEKWGWNVFPLFKLTEAMQYDYTDWRDGLHPTGFVLADVIRIMFEFIVNSLHCRINSC